jgi:aspartate/methionine/tyrosine aminotransferase
VLTPAWPNGSSSIVAMANATARQIAHPLCGDRYVCDFDALEAAVTPRTRLLLYTSPSNPLGWVATEEEQRKLLAFARRHGLWLLADEVYDRLYYAGAGWAIRRLPFCGMATRDDAVMVVHSFSKSYCMTGWRVGWLVARRDLAAKATQLNEFIISHAPSFAQKAGETALAEGEPELRRMLGAAAGESRHLPAGAGGHRRTDASQAGRRVLRVPAHRRAAAIPSRSASGCWRKRASAWRPGWPSARAARARSAFAMLPSGRFWSRPWNG